MGYRLRLASAGLAVTTATVAAAGAGGLLGLIGGLLAVVGAAGVAVTESCIEMSAFHLPPSAHPQLMGPYQSTYRHRCRRSHGHHGGQRSHGAGWREPPGEHHACQCGERDGRQP
jgi:hypothetical protein